MLEAIDEIALDINESDRELIDVANRLQRCGSAEYSKADAQK